MPNSTKELTPLTIENLKAADACDEGLQWITPLLKANDPKVAEKLFTHNRTWFRWALDKGFDVYSQLSKEFLATNDMLPMTTSGDRAPASTTGGYAPASATGDYSHASTTGYRAPASATGRACSAFVNGTDSRVRGAIGCCLIAIYYTDSNTIARAATGTVGENNIEANVWYQADASTGKLVKSADQSEPEWEGVPS